MVRSAGRQSGEPHHGRFRRSRLLLLRRECYWTATSFWIELSKEEKRATERHSTPRWEITATQGLAGSRDIRPGGTAAHFEGRDTDSVLGFRWSRVDLAS